MGKNLYKEGDVFGVPLQCGVYARGVVARASDGVEILVAYFFEPALLELSHCVDDISPEKVIKILRCGDLGIVDGSWPLIGKISNWNRDLWPSPKFFREDPLRGKGFLIKYSDENPLFIESREPYEGNRKYERDGVAGKGYIEGVLTDMLCSHAK